MISIALPSELFAIAQSSHYDGDLPWTEIAVGPDTFTFTTPMHWNVQVTNTGEAFLMMGSLRGKVSAACARCLQDAIYDIDAEVDGYYVIEPGDETFEDLDEVEFGVVSADHTIDIEDALRSALLLALPMTPLCREDCKGLCPTCGADLNDGPCGCAKSDSPSGSGIDQDNPFAVLSTLSFD